MQDGKHIRQMGEIRSGHPRTGKLANRLFTDSAGGRLKLRRTDLCGFDSLLRMKTES